MDIGRLLPIGGIASTLSPMRARALTVERSRLPARQLPAKGPRCRFLGRGPYSRRRHILATVRHLPRRPRAVSGELSEFGAGGRRPPANPRPDAAKPATERRRSRTDRAVGYTTAQSFEGDSGGNEETRREAG